MSTDNNSFELIRVGDIEVRAGGERINGTMASVAGLGVSAITCLTGMCMNGSVDIRSTIGTGVLASLAYIGFEKSRDGFLPAIK